MLAWKDLKRLCEGISLQRKTSESPQNLFSSVKSEKQTDLINVCSSGPTALDRKQQTQLQRSFSFLFSSEMISELLNCYLHVKTVSWLFPATGK